MCEEPSQSGGSPIAGAGQVAPFTRPQNGEWQRRERQRKVSLPRYYFHTRRGQATQLDHVGVDLADVQDAALEAARRGRGIASADALNRNPPTSLVIVVADEQWSPVFEVVVEELKYDI